MASYDMARKNFPAVGYLSRRDAWAVFAEIDRLREALGRIADRPNADAEDAVDMREIAREALSRPENERG